MSAPNHRPSIYSIPQPLSRGAREINRHEDSLESKLGRQINFLRPGPFRLRCCCCHILFLISASDAIATTLPLPFPRPESTEPSHRALGASRHLLFASDYQNRTWSMLHDALRGAAEKC